MALYDRLRALCCRHWCIAPPELDRMVARGELYARDVLELVQYLAVDPVTMFGLTSYLTPEALEQQAEAERDQRAVNGFGKMLTAIPITPKTPEEAAFLAALKRQTAAAANNKQ